MLDQKLADRTDMLRLFRGIAVSPSDEAAVTADIRAEGLRVTAATKFVGLFFDRRSQLPTLRDKPDLDLADTRDRDEVSAECVCACGRERGAAHYALVHNRTAEHTVALLIEFSARLDNVYVDGRDFLYSVFQAGRSAARAEAVARFFGPAALRYAEVAWKAPADRQHYRIAVCDLACQDPEVVAQHYSNETLFEGRYSTHFESAFLVRCPVPAAQIHSVRHPDGEYDFTPALCVYDLRP